MLKNKVKPNGGKLIEHTQQIGKHGFISIILDGEDSPIVFHSNSDVRTKLRILFKENI